MRLLVDRNYLGTPLPATRVARLNARVEADKLLVDVDAPFYGDPSPIVEPGSCNKLWEHEVVELFLADEADHYLEIELGPYGHYLVIELQGERRVLRSELPIEYVVRIERAPAPRAGEPIGRFIGQAIIPASYLTMQVVRANAYFIHGTGLRCHHAHASVPGAVPDFHRLECFVPFQL